MPMHDHFRPPVYGQSAWESFHAGWAVSIRNDLNRRLPPRFLAEVKVHLGTAVEADVAEFDQAGSKRSENGSPEAGGGGGVATAVAALTYSPPAAKLSMPLNVPPELTVQVWDLDRDRQLAGVVELVSPANKDRPVSRRIFAAKVAGYLGVGAGVVVADLVTTMHFNLHDELIHAMQQPETLCMAGGSATYVVAYRPVHRKDENMTDIWPNPLSVGQTLPAVPLALRAYGCVRLNLEETYTEACGWARIS
jgi:hypothetical protein